MIISIVFSVCVWMRKSLIQSFTLIMIQWFIRFETDSDSAVKQLIIQFKEAQMFIIVFLLSLSLIRWKHVTCRVVCSVSNNF